MGNYPVMLDSKGDPKGTIPHLASLDFPFKLIPWCYNVINGNL